MDTTINETKCTQALLEIARCGRIPYEDHGTKLGGGERKHMYSRFDWADLVRSICEIVYGRPADADYVSCRMVGALVRDEFPNNPQWNDYVNRPGAHQRILEIILDGLGRLGMGASAVSDQ